CREWGCWHGCGRRDAGPSPHCGDHDHQFHCAGHGSNRQSRRENLLHVWRTVPRPAGDSHPWWWWTAALCHSFTEPGSLVCPRARPQGCSTIDAVKKTNRAIVFEEDWRSYGVGAEIAALLQEEAFDFLDAPVQRVASLELPLPYSKPLERAALTGAKQLEEAIQKITPRRRR